MTLQFVRSSCLALALLAVVAGQGAAQKDKKAKDKEASDPINVTAVELTTAYGNTTEANKKYSGKTLIVEGKIHSTTKIVTLVVILEGFKGPKEKESRRVLCSMKPGTKAADFKRGDTVRIRGTCKGNGISQTVTVDLASCEVVK